MANKTSRLMFTSAMAIPERYPNTVNCVGPKGITASEVTRLDVRNHLALDPRQVSVYGQHDENKNEDLDDRNDQERILGENVVHDFASASGKDCIIVQNFPSEPLVKRLSFAERIS